MLYGSMPLQIAVIVAYLIWDIRVDDKMRALGPITMSGDNAMDSPALAF